VAICLERLARDEPTEIFGTGQQARDFVHVADVARAVLAAVGHQGGVFNVGTGVATTVEELHRLCREVAGSEREPDYASARAGDLERSVLDVSRAREQLGWAPELDLRAGLAQTWAWLRER